MNTTEVYNLLFAGKTLELEFDTESNAETFRTRMHRMKAAEEKHLVGLGMIDEDDVTSFSFLRQGKSLKYRLSFTTNVKQRKQYDVKIIDDESNGQQQVT